MFIQFTTQATDDVVIPDEAGKSTWTLSFGTLKAAQVMGDGQALRDGGRAVILFDLGADAVAGLKKALIVLHNYKTSEVSETSEALTKKEKLL
ncbi:MAG: hypothetical protein IPO77_21885 [Acidobacteria bacterium]|nr:hypothetical protein [Acidobacteriota bacterium]